MEDFKVYESKPPLFSGKHRDWPVWSEQFLARARKKSFVAVLLGRQNVPAEDTVLDVSTSEGVERIRAREANNNAYDDLIMGINGKDEAGRVAFRLVATSKSAKLPGGDAAMAWKRLCEKYRPNTAPSRLNLIKKFHSMKLESATRDPDEWLTELEDLRAQLELCGRIISDDELLEHVLNNVPTEYDIAVSKLEDKLGTKLTIEMVRAEFNLRFQRLNPGTVESDGKRGPSNGKGSETALFAGGFKGRCHKCGKIGHKSPDCKEKKEAQGGKEVDKGSVKCFHCGKKGHKSFQYWDNPNGKNFRKKNDQASIAKDDSSEDVVLMCCEEIGLATREKELGEEGSLYIADTGASCHMTHTDKGMFEWEPINEKITLGNGAQIVATKQGKKAVTLKQQDGKSIEVILTNVKYVPALAPYNLFSITAALDKGFKLGNEGKALTLTKGGVTIKFDKLIPTKSGWVCGATMEPRNKSERSIEPRLKEGKAYEINSLHELFGHQSHDTLQRTAKYYEYRLKGSFEECEDCAQAKARQRNLGQAIEESRAKKVGERLHMDISSIKSESFGGAKYWLLIMDEFSGYCWSHMLIAKSETKTKLLETLRYKWDVEVKSIRCDNAGENHKAREELEKAGFGVEFEFTASNTPQQNGKVERKFATLYGRVRSMLNGADVPEEMRKKLWAECATTATFLENVTVRKDQEEPPLTIITGKQSKRIPYLRRFGEIGIVKQDDGMINKLHNKGTPAMFVGYALSNPKDTYRMLNLETLKINVTRDVRWLNVKYNAWKARKREDNFDLEEKEVEVELIPVKETRFDLSQLQKPNLEGTSTSEGSRRVTDVIETPTGPINRRLTRELRRLETSYNSEASKMLGKEEEQESKENDSTRVAIEMLFGEEFAFFMRQSELEEIPEARQVTRQPWVVTDSSPIDELENIQKDREVSAEERAERIKVVVNYLKENVPETFDDAWNHPDVKQKERWRSAIMKEKRDFQKNEVMKKIKRQEMPADRRCVKCKWVFDVKRDGRFRARLVACGYTQIPGVDFTSTYAPVINDITWRILIILKIVRKLDARIIDVETAFLLGELDEEIYMEVPPGYEKEDDDVMKLLKSVYGLAQAARQYYKRFIKALKKIGFVGGVADPCLFMRENEKGIVYIAIWVDDSLMVGNKQAIDSTIDELKKEGFILKIEGTLDDYLSCEITFDDKVEKAWIHQPHLIKKLKQKFGKIVDDVRVPKTPATPGMILFKENGKMLNEEDHKLYRSGVGMLLYLVKHTRPDIANAVRELSKCLDGPSEAAFKELKRGIKYVLNTENLALKVHPKLEDGMFSMVAFSDSDYAADPETRRSITGFILYFCGVPISWKSKSQKSVTLSSSEAEYVALSETAKEIKFVYQVLMSMGIEVKIPIIVRVDNVGAIFMSESIAVTQNSKHVDTRYRFVNEFVEEGFLKIIFVRTFDNDADLFTKNLNGDIHKKHTDKMVEEKTMKKVRFKK